MIKPFKADWEKTSLWYQMSQDVVNQMVELAYPNLKLSSYELLVGGCSNINVKIQLEGKLDPLLLRIYLRDSEASYREQKLGALVTPEIPIPRIYYVGEVDSRRFSIAEFINGTPLRDLLLGNFTYDIDLIMYEIGIILSKIAAYKFLRAGFFDENLDIIEIKDDFALDFAKECLRSEQASRLLPKDIICKINYFLDKYKYVLPSKEEKNLVHGDFDPANVLVSQINGSWKVSGILGFVDN